MVGAPARITSSATKGKGGFIALREYRGGFGLECSRKKENGKTAKSRSRRFFR